MKLFAYACRRRWLEFAHGVTRAGSRCLVLAAVAAAPTLAQAQDACFDVLGCALNCSSESCIDSCVSGACDADAEEGAMDALRCRNDCMEEFDDAGFCFGEFCLFELSMCEADTCSSGGSTGGGSPAPTTDPLDCSELMICMGECNSGSCVQGCVADASSLAASQADNLLSCAHDSCGELDGSAFSECLQSCCGDELTQCTGEAVSPATSCSDFTGGGSGGSGSSSSQGGSSGSGNADGKTIGDPAFGPTGSSDGSGGGCSSAASASGFAMWPLALALGVWVRRRQSH